jgi:hypothetical protein
MSNEPFDQIEPSADARRAALVLSIEPLAKELEDAVAAFSSDDHLRLLIAVIEDLVRLTERMPDVGGVSDPEREELVDTAGLLQASVYGKILRFEKAASTFLAALEAAGVGLGTRIEGTSSST